MTQTLRAYDVEPLIQSKKSVRVPFLCITHRSNASSGSKKTLGFM
jgi:hypothetical protein